MEKAITSNEQAKQHLVQWMRNAGYRGKIRFSVSYGLQESENGNYYYDFDVLQPYGVFRVYEEGRVDDRYQALDSNSATTE